MDDFQSINEPGKSRQNFSPPSINEPPVPPDVTPPTVGALDPPTCVITDPDFTLDVTGTGFKDGYSVIVFDNQDMATTFNDETTLSAPISPASFTSPARTVQCLVRTGPLESNALEFVFTEPAPPPEELKAHTADPDELEEEIEEAEDEGDFRPTHASHHTKVKRKKK